MLAIAALLLAPLACVETPREGGMGELLGAGDESTGGPQPETDAEDEATILDERVLDYAEALRTAHLKLTDRLPPLAKVKRVAGAADPRVEYEALLDELLETPAFRRRMIRWWRDVFRQGGGALDTAPVFAARVMVEGRPYGELLTASDSTCPTYDSENDVFVDGDCDNGVAEHAGVLTNPGTMKQFYSSMAFRRVRWVQEIFACTKFPAEYSDEPLEMGAGSYTSPWDFDSISSAPIDFKDTSAVICANCHTTINHLAPLLASFDEEGIWRPTIQVMTPIAPDPVKSELSHWLREGETTFWRLGVPANDLPALGKAMAADPAIRECLVARMWNFTMSKEDIVSDLATVPLEVIAPFVDELAQNGGDLKRTLRAMFASDDFVRF